MSFGIRAKRPSAQPDDQYEHTAILDFPLLPGSHEHKPLDHVTWRASVATPRSSRKWQARVCFANKDLSPSHSTIVGSIAQIMTHASRVARSPFLWSLLVLASSLLFSAATVCAEGTPRLRLYMVRHGETLANVEGIVAGQADSVSHPN